MRRISSIISCLFLGMASGVHAGTEIYELEAIQSASMSATGCCSISYASNFNASTLTTRTCQEVYMSCVGSRRAAMWRFDLSELPDDVTPVSVHLVGTRTERYMTGSGFMSVVSNASDLDSQVGLHLYNSGHYQSSINWNYGNDFTFTLNSTLNNGLFAKSESFAVMVYGATTSGINIMNAGSSAPKLRVVVDTPDSPPCVADLDGDNEVNASDLGAFLWFWGPNPGPADFNGDGVVNSSDLGVLLGAWGACP